LKSHGLVDIFVTSVSKVPKGYKLSVKNVLLSFSASLFFSDSNAYWLKVTGRFLMSLPLMSHSQHQKGG
jgi:hypothetical protein